MSFRILQGDALTVLRTLPAESVNCCVTSPPYWGLRSYGTPDLVWGGDAGCEHEWGETISVNATNHTDKRRWNHTRNGRDEEQPIEKRVAWLRTTVDQGNVCSLCGAWRGSLGLEPTPELYVQHLVEIFREVRRVLRADGTLWLNLGDSYNAHPGQGTVHDKAGYKQSTNRGSTEAASRNASHLKAKDLIGIPWRVAFALQSDGWWLRSDIIWHKPNPMPESVRDRPTKAHEYIFLMAKSQRYYYDAEAIKEVALKGAANSNFNTGKTAIHQLERASDTERREDGKRNRRSVWTVSTYPVKEAHFATYPPDLIEPCILAGCPEGGTVLDPFGGAGTTALACLTHGRKTILIELNPEYIQIAESRLHKHMPLFAAQPQ